MPARAITRVVCSASAGAVVGESTPSRIAASVAASIAAAERRPAARTSSRSTPRGASKVARIRLSIASISAAERASSASASAGTLSRRDRCSVVISPENLTTVRRTKQCQPAERRASRALATGQTEILEQPGPLQPRTGDSKHAYSATSHDEHTAAVGAGAVDAPRDPAPARVGGPEAAQPRPGAHAPRPVAGGGGRDQLDPPATGAAREDGADAAPPALNAVDVAPAVAVPGRRGDTAQESAAGVAQADAADVSHARAGPAREAARRSHPRRALAHRQPQVELATAIAKARSRPAVGRVGAQQLELDVAGREAPAVRVELPDGRCRPGGRGRAPRASGGTAGRRPRAGPRPGRARRRR